MSDHEILYPKPVAVTVEGRAVAIRPVQFRHFETFGKAAGDVLSMVANASSYEIYKYAKDSGALAEIIGHATDMSAWRRRRLPAAVAVELMLHVIKVNAGFFEQALVRAASLLAGAPSRSA